MRARSALVLALAGCGGSGPAGPDAAPLPTGPLTSYGAGPASRDNGVAEACTGPTGAGRQVLCVGAGERIADVLAIARDGDVIQVSTGTYAETVKHGDYLGTCDNGGVALNVSLLGGFRDDFAARDAAEFPTTVTGDGAAPGFVVCVMGGQSTIDGFVVTTGGVDRGIVASAGGFGGEGGTLVVSHNVVHHNSAPGTIDDATFGGGIVARTFDGTIEVSDNFVYANVSGRGAGIVTQGAVTVTRNRVERNTARGSHGGGMYIAGAAEVSYNVVVENELLGELGGGGWGAGFIVDGNSERPHVEVHHNVVIGNVAASYASGEFYDEDVDAVVAFELVSANGCVTDRRSSGILVDVGGLGSSTVSFRNLTVVAHHCPTAEVGALVVQGGATASVEDSVFWDNLGTGGEPLDFGIDDTGAITVARTVTQQGHAGDNTTEDPGFVDAASGLYASTAFPDRGAFAPGGLSPEP